MGLLKRLILLPLAPVEGVVWLAEQLRAEAERRLHDPDAVLAELDDLQQQLDAGAISEAEYLAHEDALLDRLDALMGASEDQAEEGATP